MKGHISTKLWISSTLSVTSLAVLNYPAWENQTTWPACWEICMQVKKQQLELDMEQQTGSKRKRSTSRLYIVTLLV